MRPLTLVLIFLICPSVWAATPPAPAPEARKPVAAADQAGDAVRQSARELYMLSTQCTRDVLGPYVIGKTVPEGQAPQLSPGDKIHRQRGPFVDGSRSFNAREALACRDLESVALVLMESAQRIGSKQALREMIPTLESRFKAAPVFGDKANLGKEIEGMKKRL